MYASGHALGDGAVAARHGLFGNHGLEEFGVPIQLPSQSAGQEINRFRESDMPQCAFLTLLLECLQRQSRPNLLLKGDSAN